ncbi:MAG: hypothetical protein O7D35_06420 [Acidobacteria bacterium]|nr:hypothetical protein [Acidobacteriota bacterium]
MQGLNALTGAFHASCALVYTALLMGTLKPLPATLTVCAILATTWACSSPARRQLRHQAAPETAAGLMARRQLLEENRARVYPGWARAESLHFILLTPPDSPIAADPDTFLARREAAYQRIVEALKVEPDGPIRIYAYRSSRQGEKLLGRPLAFALPAEKEIHVRWDQEPGHEEAHVVAWYWNLSGSGEPFLEEGLAVALSSHPGSPQASAADLLARGVLPDLGDLIAHFSRYRNGYVLAGSFVALLLERHDEDLLRQLYTGGPEDLAERLEDATGQTLAQLQTWWETSLAAQEPVTREPILEALALLRLGEAKAAIGVLEKQRLTVPAHPVLEFALAQALRQDNDEAGSALAFRRLLAMPLPYNLAWMKQRAREALNEMGHAEKVP